MAWNGTQAGWIYLFLPALWVMRLRHGQESGLMPEDFYPIPSLSVTMKSCSERGEVHLWPPLHLTLGSISSQSVKFLRSILLCQIALLISCKCKQLIFTQCPVLAHAFREMSWAIDRKPELHSHMWLPGTWTCITKFTLHVTCCRWVGPDFIVLNIRWI